MAGGGGTKRGAARGTFKDPRYLGEAAQRLRELRAGAGLTQKQVAAAVGIRERAVYEWEKGERIPMAVLPEIAELFQTSTSFILHGIEPADTALAAMKEVVDLVLRELLALRADVHEIATRLHSVHEAVAEVTEEAAAGFEAVRARDERSEDDEDPPEAEPRSAPSARRVRSPGRRKPRV